MGSNKCTTLIGLWGVGFDGQCLGNQYGFLIGARGFKYAMIEVIMIGAVVDTVKLLLSYEYMSYNCS